MTRLVAVLVCVLAVPSARADVPRGPWPPHEPHQPKVDPTPVPIEAVVAGVAWAAAMVAGGFWLVRRGRRTTTRPEGTT